MPNISRTLVTFCGAVALCAAAVSTQADLVVMQNGDRYTGKVLSATTTNLVLQSDVLGIVTLSRAKVASVAFGTNAVAGPLTSTLPAKSAAVADVSSSLRQLGAQTNLIQKVQSQFLAAAGPEANEEFGRMLNDLTTGKMTIADLRAKAKDVADQLRSLQCETDDDGGFTTGIYLSILDHFLEETGAANKATTNSTGAAKPQLRSR